jgi:hypothetical protein
VGIGTQFSGRFFLLAITCILFSVRCDLCGNEIGYEEYSPDRRLKAAVFERDCGATTGFSTQVSILRSAEKLPHEGGNVFITHGDLAIRVQWQSNNEMLIVFPPGAKVHFRPSNVAGVSVRYEE